ncbi:MAG: hypothetical protein IIY49_05955 [Eubacterium sp.]|nr:hypothetical protein [Eubacterium sp.]
MGKGKNGFLGIFKVDDSDQDYDEEDMDMFDDDYDDEDSDESAFSGIGTFFANKKKEKEQNASCIDLFGDHACSDHRLVPVAETAGI